MELTAEAYSTNIVASVWLYLGRLLVCLALSSANGKCIIGMQMLMVHRTMVQNVIYSYLTTSYLSIYLCNRHIYTCESLTSSKNRKKKKNPVPIYCVLQHAASIAASAMHCLNQYQLKDIALNGPQNDPFPDHKIHNFWIGYSAIEQRTGKLIAHSFWVPGKGSNCT